MTGRSETFRTAAGPVHAARFGTRRATAAARGIGYQIPRNTLALLMVAQVVVVLPYLFHLPPWIIGVVLFCGCWRTGVYQGRWGYPQRWVKALLVLASLGGIAVSGMTMFSLEAAASLLILAFALKLVEMKGRRDAYLVIFLAYFIIATQFLFDQSLAVAAYQLAAMVVVTAAMIGLNQLLTRVRPLPNLRLAATLILQALPLTVVLFVFFPRIAPLWTVPLPNSATTGISDVMTPGDVADLARSDELAFRVVFDGPVPANRDLYWRGLIYSSFTEGTWSVGPRLPPWVGRAPVDPAEHQGAGYEVLLEPTQSDWLFALETPVPLSRGVALTRDYRLEAMEPVMSMYRYRAAWDPATATDTELPGYLYQRETSLPDGDSPRIRAWARELFERTGDTAAFIEAVLATIRSEPYFYTLRPPELARQNSIDQFWFETRRGFCSHYAGALVFMLRSLDIPARLVGGYQGGAVNPVTGHLMVRQYDAHAWVEVWQPGTGWQRVDPTTAVAPARIEEGMNAALSEADRESLSALTNARLSGLGMIRGLLYWADSLEHRWNLWVIGYDGNLQHRFLTEMLGEITPARIGAAALAAGGVCVGGLALVLLWRRRRQNRHPVERMFRRFCDAIAGTGWVRKPGEAPGAFIARIADQGGLRPENARALIADLNRLLYNPDADAQRHELRQLQAQFTRARFRLLMSAVR